MLFLPLDLFATVVLIPVGFFFQNRDHEKDGCREKDHHLAHITKNHAIQERACSDL